VESLLPIFSRVGGAAALAGPPRWSKCRGYPSSIVRSPVLFPTSSFLYSFFHLTKIPLSAFGSPLPRFRRSQRLVFPRVPLVSHRPVTPYSGLLRSVSSIFLSMP